MFEKMKNWLASRSQMLRTIADLKKELQKAKESKVTVINKAPVQKEDPWHLILSEDNEYWIRPKRVSYVSPVSYCSFLTIIEGVETSFSFKSHDEAMRVRNILLNINSIPTSNTYERKKEPSEILSSIERKIPMRQRITQEDIDNMELRNAKK